MRWLHDWSYDGRGDYQKWPRPGNAKPMLQELTATWLLRQWDWKREPAFRMTAKHAELVFNHGLISREEAESRMGVSQAQ